MPPMTLAIWSMMPQRTPANSCSAFWQSFATSAGARSIPRCARIAVAVSRLEGRAARKTRSDGHRARDRDAERRYGSSHRRDASDDAERIIHPRSGGDRRPWRTVHAERMGIEGRDEDDPEAVAGSDGDGGAPVDRHRQDVAVVVIGVLADEVHATRRRRQRDGFGGEDASVEIRRDFGLSSRRHRFMPRVVSPADVLSAGRCPASS